MTTTEYLHKNFKVPEILEDFGENKWDYFTSLSTEEVETELSSYRNPVEIEVNLTFSISSEFVRAMDGSNEINEINDFLRKNEKSLKKIFQYRLDKWLENLSGCEVETAEIFSKILKGELSLED